jgi:anti-anti-sigma factor
MNNLEINREDHDDEIVLRCTGRLDANHSGHLNDFIDRLVREGHYHIALNLEGIEYLSSAGIRSLVTQYKNLKSINGYFYITAMAENVDQVLNMVGMADMLCLPPKKTKPIPSQEEPHNQLKAHGFNYKQTELSSKEKTVAHLYGQPELTMKSGFNAQHARIVKSEDRHFAFGLGAIGESYDECKNRFGEYLMFGQSIAYLPADGSKKPDYMVSSGQLVATLSELYGLHFDGNFSHLIRFEAEIANKTISLSDLVEDIQQLTKYKQWAMVMVSESGGLIGTSLNASPVDGKKIFTYPELKECINFTTEPAYNKMLTLSLAYFNIDKDKEIGKFIRPIGSEKLNGHVHTAVFPYIPLKKTDIDLDETINYLFNSSELTDILHLTNDNREITGLGESQFVQGFCWIVPIESTTIVAHQ